MMGQQILKTTNCQSTNPTLPHTDNVYVIMLLQLYRTVQGLILNQLGLGRTYIFMFFS